MGSTPAVGDSGPARVDEFSAWFIEQFSVYWQSGGGARIEGRIAAYLLISESPGVSAEELAQALGASRGSVSTYIRRLIDRGFVTLTRRPRDRTHYYVMESDVWGGFLETEHLYLENQRKLATEALQYANPDGPAYIRVLNMRDYMGWITDNRMLSSEWARFKADRDSGKPASE